MAASDDNFSHFINVPSIKREIGLASLKRGMTDNKQLHRIVVKVTCIQDNRMQVEIATVTGGLRVVVQGFSYQKMLMVYQNPVGLQAASKKMITWEIRGSQRCKFACFIIVVTAGIVIQKE